MAVVTMTGGGWGPGAKKYQTSTNVAPQSYSYTSPTATTAMQQTRQQTPAQQTQQQQQQQPNAAQTAAPAQRSELANYMNQYYGQKGFFAGDINKARNDFQQWKGQQPAAAPAAGGQSALSQQLGNPAQAATPAAAAAPAVQKNAYQTWLDQQAAKFAGNQDFDEGRFRRTSDQNLGQNYGAFSQWMRDEGYAGDTRNLQAQLRQQYNVDGLGGIITPAGAAAYNASQDAFQRQMFNKAKSLGFLGVDPFAGQYGKSHIRAV